MSQKDKVLKILQGIEFPKQGRHNITGDKKGNNLGVVLGKVRDFSGRSTGGIPKVITGRYTNMPKYKPLFEEASKLMKQHNPNFKFTSIQVNKNQKASKHKDGNNVGKSYIIGLGDYTGGEVRVYDEQGDKFHDINIKNRWGTFDGSKLEHETLAFKGERYSLVYYNVN